VSGAGKTSVGPVVAEKLGLDICDTDEGFEEFFGVNGGEIISSDGIAKYRAMESEFLESISTQSNLVISTGAGAWTIDKFREVCLEKDLVFWLHATPRVLIKRIFESDRVISKIDPPNHVILSQISERAELYALAHYVIDTNMFDLDEVGDLICKLVKETV
jgi:shikimate kinase